MAHHVFSCYDTIFRGTVRRILKNTAFFQEKVSLKKKAIFSFVQNGVSICSRSSFLSGRMLFLVMKQGYASPATELLEFFEEMEREKKHKKLDFGQKIIYVLGCNTLRWTEIAY